MMPDTHLVGKEFHGAVLKVRTAVRDDPLWDPVSRTSSRRRLRGFDGHVQFEQSAELIRTHQ